MRFGAFWNWYDNMPMYSIVDLFKRVWFHLWSSIFLVRKMVSFLELAHTQHIVELGAGDGRVTKEILSHLGIWARLDIFEIDPSQLMVLRSLFADDTRVTIHETSAAHIDTIFASWSIDSVISTLPLGSISHPWVDHILRSVFAILKPGWHYLQYQYWMANKKDIKKYFTIDTISFEPRNFTPAFIYRARKTRARV